MVFERGGMGRVILILGGARSGKSAYAQQIAKRLCQGKRGVIYIATAVAGDEEMQERIARHRAARPPFWKTLEAPRKAARVIEEIGEESQVIILDCLTLLVSNLMLDKVDGETMVREEDILGEVESLVQTAKGVKSQVIVVSNEVGLGIVPTTKLGCLFRDIAGRANQLVAREADEVYVMWAGIATRVKGS
jgi:adenosylcobinamide kinase/adenosylcobinamide-phosphate guanylyltransferase